MPRTAATSAPEYRLHRESRQAVATLGAKDHYLGPHGAAASKREGDRLIGEWLASERLVVQRDQAQGMTITELCRVHNAFAERYHREDGRPTPTVDSLRVSLRALRYMATHGQRTSGRLPWPRSVSGSF